MFAYLEGDLVYKSASLLYLAVNGVGYEVNITLQTYSKIQALDKCRLYTHLQVREDAWVMYGFADEDKLVQTPALLYCQSIVPTLPDTDRSTESPEQILLLDKAAVPPTDLGYTVNVVWLDESLGQVPDDKYAL